ncbi:hypothetical protein [Corynebacterium stationis]|uniref:hypothetical protein n=1 Tax=Corynebacterium stationis TaxID=1705 RepID=UPI0028A9660F|nr:hypothetical protein [Corynebacterium stationis]
MLSKFYHSPIENLTDNAHPCSAWQVAKDPDQPGFWVFHIDSPSNRTAFTTEQLEVFLDVLETSLYDADEPIPYSLA